MTSERFFQIVGIPFRLPFALIGILAKTGVALFCHEDARNYVWSVTNMLKWVIGV